MRVFNDLKNLPSFRNAVVTIGSFDGVHLGHQQILKKVNDLANSVDGESIVITFHPHPRLVVYPKDTTMKLITTIDEKVQLMERYQVDNVVVAPFTIEFSQQSADEYIQKFLVEKFHPRYIVIGYDHRFGLNRQGDINYLKWHGPEGGYKVIEIPRHEVDHMAVSSTKIRNAMDKGDVSAAQRLLGHPFTLTGTVIHGNKIGHKLGFPTANLDIGQKHKLLPPTGIYAVHVLHNRQRYGGMLYIGSRPTLREFHNHTIEVNIFGFNKDVYGDKLQLELLERIRDDVQFEKLEELQKQLEKDRLSAKKILEARQEPREEKKMSQYPRVAVVILNYNGQAFLEQFLPTVLASTYPNYEVIIADNGSLDDSLAFLGENYPNIKTLDLKGNHGYAKGYNLALRQIDAPYYILLNSDVEVTEGWIEPIIELMERDPTVGACQPKIKAYHNRNYFEYAGAAGGWLDNLGYPFCRGRIFAVTERDSGQYEPLQEIFWATGAAFFVRSRLFHELGGFDPDYFAHSEEIDLCWRIKRAGYKVMARPRSVVYHVGGGTLDYNTPQKAYLNFRNSLFNLLKNEEVRRLWWLIPLRFLLDWAAAGLFLFQGKLGHIKSIGQAHRSFFSYFRKMLKKRREARELIQKVSISPAPNMAGRYPGSIVWQYYARGKKYFKQLVLR
ncbi:MAG: bifunctional riboflavin kinase/FAD synthetase [Lewinellaceae bacterium]|nr:bifunctional riboflavin kinase/FAD synthetase [Lewinellaceae bacterium]MCB9288768.1 bifunctional riboflavin kinase/FAD synthetase [Lewinellaceae bacterium]